MESIHNETSVAELSQDEQNKHDIEILNEFRGNQENIIKAQTMANQIREDVSKNWFTLGQMCKKFKLSAQEAQNKLMMLHIFELTATKMEKGVQLFKIDINKEAQKNLIHLELASLEIKMKYLKEKLEKLN